MEHENVIIKPLITEKSTRQQERLNARAFLVRLDANKYQIKQAVEKLYNVKVLEVRTLVRKGKPRRSRYRLTTTSTWKRAVVVLDKDSKIEVY
jgi:large subunit ribosomal protein L23